MTILDDSALYQDILRIFEQATPIDTATYSAKIRVGDNVVDLLKVLSISTQRQYRENYSDVTLLEVTVGAGTYSQLIYPFKQSLRVQITKQSVLPEGGGVRRETVPEETYEWEAVLIETASAAVTVGNEATSNIQAGDNARILTINLQLTHPHVSTLRKVQVGGVFRNTTVTDVLKGLFSYRLQEGSVPSYPLSKQDVIDGGITTQTIGADVVDGDNERVYDHIVIPHNTRLIDIPNYLQKTYGVYKTGIGYYFQQGIWFIYPLFHLNRFEKSTLPLIIANVDQSRFSEVERTYQVDDKQLYGRTYILATGEVNHQDNSEHIQLNKGNAFVQVDAKEVMDVFADIEANEVSVDSDKNIVGYSSELRTETDSDFMLFSERYISATSYNEQAMLAQQLGSVLQLVWNHSDIDVLYPGMPVKLLYIDKDNETVALHGSVFSTEQQSQQVQQSITEHRHVSHSAVTLFLQRHKED